MRSPHRSLTLAALVCSSLSAAFAQTPKPAAGKYAGEPYVIQRLDLVYDMKADGTGSMQRTVGVTVQADSALREFGVIHVPFASATEHVEFAYIRVRRPDGSVTETPGSGVIEQPTAVTREAPFYSDQKEAQLPVKNLQVGDTLEWQARVVRTKAEARNQFWGSETFLTDFGVVLEESVELRVPAAAKTIVWTNPEVKAKPAETTQGDRKIYRWETSSLRPTTGAEADAEKKAKKTRLLTPAEETDAELGKLPSVAWTTFQSWAEVGAWYRGLEATRALPDDEIKAEAAQLTAGMTTDEEKVKALYAYVSTKIRYIGVAFGIGRYQPHAASDVLHNQYGDCKDKALLLTSLLAAAGISSDAALIGAGVRFNEAVPSPGAFNHLITHLRVSGQEVWLDSTEEIAPYRMMYYGLRDHEALVVPPTGTAVIEKTPKSPPFASAQTWITKGSLNAEGVSESHIVITLRGDDELALRAVVRQISPSQYEEAMQRFANGMGYSGTTSHAHFSPPEDTTVPFTMEFDYHREKAGDWPNLKTIPQLAPVSLPTVDEASPPVASINLGVPAVNVSAAEMKLPEGWRAELPEAVHEKTVFATYDMTYRFEKGTIYTERTYTVLQQKVPAAEWKTYKKFTDAISLGNETYIQLVKPAEKTTASGQASGQEWIAEAQKAYVKRDAAGLELVLQRQKALDPKQRRLHAWQGSLAELHGNLAEAIEDNREELKLYPDETDRYATISTFQRRQRDTTGQEATLRQWLVADPRNLTATLQLGDLLIEIGRPQAALDVIDATLAKLSESERFNPRLMLLAGRAYLKAGARDKGVAKLSLVLKSSSDPALINDSAYELADADAELPLDEEKEHLAIDTLTVETESWTMDEPIATLRSKTHLLAAAWDTLGWIYFREHKLAEAKVYIDAAYRNRPDAEVTRHWKALNAALGVSDDSHAEAGKTSGHEADATVTATAPPGLATPSLTLGPSNGTSGAADYNILFSAGRIERFEPGAGKRLESAEALLRQASVADFFPRDSHAKLVYRALLRCSEGRCVLELLP